MRPATLPVSPALPPDPFRPDPLRLLSAQADLQYHAAPSRGIFNPPAATGMGFWSINPYVGCAFGCAYCYARDTHRFTLERVGDIGRQVANAMPPWLAFERRVLVKERAGAAGRAAHRDAPAMLEALVQQVAAAGAKSLGAGALRLRSASRKRYLPVIRENFPELSARYEATYRHSVYAADSYRAGLQQVIEQWCRKYGLTTREYRRDDGDADSEVALPEPLVPELQLVLL